jgi:hypothetical protein
VIHAGGGGHPVRFIVEDDLGRRRLTVLLRPLLALPHLVWAALWIGSLAVFVPFQWLWALVAGALAPDAHAMVARFVRYHVHLAAYLLVLAAPFPSFDGRPGYPVDVQIAPPVRQNRATVLVRVPLAVPAAVFSSVLAVVSTAVGVAGWAVALVLGRMPVAMHELGVYALRYQTQMLAYVLLLTSTYPSLATENPATTPAARE